MAFDFEFFSSADKPALMAVTTPKYAELARMAAEAAAYKVHVATTNQQFQDLFSRASYQLVILEATFGGEPGGSNSTLKWIQRLGMPLRRHAVVILLGDAWETLDPLIAFQESVHAVVNYAEIELLARIIERVVGDNDNFLQPFRNAQERAFKV
jgi:DNA-binding response OmpR family regulator